MNDRKSSALWNRSERVLNDAEIGFLSKHASILPALLSQYDVQVEDGISAGALDDLFRQWSIDASGRRISDSDFVGAVGISLGNYLRARFDMQWVEITDDQGTTYAVRHKSKRIYCFPIEAVKKRVGSSEYGFITLVVEWVSEALSDPSREGEIADL